MFVRTFFWGAFSYLESNLYDRCDHEKCKSAFDCIKEVIGQNNSEHFFVATQDTDLRKTFQEVSLFCLLLDAIAYSMF